ncbi:hypothetical protein DFH08DRAFT_819155 [Mycena albidolilacea]|uniref:Uncharacterized protein n=1 Tax=Mycena albidolilacea TaxID=1033008 RepID=A0AAD6ZFF0_9AGAR|nr:hypothetical protein DFH08DRAFT_819155 [Mycena albidolilacea]
MASIIPSLLSNNPFRVPSNPWTAGNQQATSALPPPVFTPVRPVDPHLAQQPRPYVPGGHRVPVGYIDESQSFDSLFADDGEVHHPPRTDQYSSVSGYVADHGLIYKALTLNPGLAAKQQMPKTSGPSTYAATGTSFAKKKERDHCNNPSCKSPTGHSYPYCISPGGGMAGQTVEDARAKKRADDGRAGGGEKRKTENVKVGRDKEGYAKEFADFYLNHVARCSKGLA